MLRDCESEAAADAAAARFIGELGGLRAANVAVVWTVHNELPHEIGFHRQFLALRAALARSADAILVHNAASIDVLRGQVALDRAKVHVLPHPSYLGVLESEERLRAGLDDPVEPRIQGFGWIRKQKGFAEMIAMLPRPYLRSLGACVRISGSGPEAAEVAASLPDRDDVRWDVRHVPQTEIAHLLRSAACVVLPYQRVLTSGTALLAMSAGAMLVAVDIPQLRELLPPAARRFLYPRDDGAALREAIAGIFALSSHERRSIIEANLEVAATLRPAAIAQRLAGIYDSVVTAVTRANHGHDAMNAQASSNGSGLPNR